jgi:type I restriction enzyme, S subunit
MIPLNQLVESQKGKKPLHLSTLYTLESLPYLDIEAVEQNIIKQYADWYSSVHSTDNDIFVVRTGGRNGLILKGKKGAVGSTLICLTPLIHSDYLYYYLKLNEFKHSDKRDLKSSFWNMPIPVPSLDDQKELAQNLKNTLVALEKQSQESDRRLISSLKNLVKADSEILANIQNLAEFKKAILDLALNAKLTENWREKNGIDKKSWQNILLEDVAEFALGKKLNLSKNKGELTNYLRTVNITWFEVNLMDLKKTRVTENEKKKLSIKKGDLLICEGGDAGRTAIWNDEDTENLIFQNHIHRVRLNNNILPKWVMYRLYFDYQTGELENYILGSIIKNIPYENLKKYKFIAPSLEEQAEIIFQIESIFKTAEIINKKYSAEKQSQEELKKSIINSFYENITFLDNDSIVKEIDKERKIKKIEIETIKNKQKKILNTFFKFGEMTQKEKEVVKAQIKEIVQNDYKDYDILTEKEINEIQEKTRLKSSDFDFDDFSSVFLEMVQDKLKSSDEDPFLKPINHNGKLAYKL